MKYILHDFVNRTEQLGLMWQMAHKEIEPCILIVEARFGMGKSYLMKEFQAECREEGIELVSLDFEEKYEDPGYIYVVKEIWTQLGQQGFDPLTQVLQETMSRSGQEQAAGLFPTRTGVNAPDTDKQHESPSAGQSGGVNIYGGTNTFRDVAGRDINYFIQIIQKEDPFVQEKAKLWISDALEKCLVQIAAERKVVFLIDNWQQADPDTRKWLARSLIKWAADGSLCNANIVITGVDVPDVDPRRRIHREILPEFEESAAYTYLTEKCGLPVSDITEIIHVAGGFPLMLYLASARRKAQSASGRK